MTYTNAMCSDLITPLAQLELLCYIYWLWIYLFILILFIYLDGTVHINDRTIV